MIFFKKYSVLILLTILTIPAIWPLFHAGMFISDDASWIVIRLSDFHRSLVDGQWPVRWAGRLNNGYGYPVFNFLYPGVMYAGEFLHVIFRLDFIQSVKALFAISIIFSGVFSFIWLRNRFGKFISMAGAIVYVYLPYHLYTIYTRGSLGEAVVLTLCPLVLYFADKKKIITTTLTLSLIILCHNTLAFLFLPVFIAYLLINNQKLFLIKSLILSLLLTMWFWLPAVYYQQYTIFNLTPISRYYEHFLTTKHTDLFIYNLLLIFFSVLFWKKFNKITQFWVFVAFLSLFLSINLSDILWKYSPINGIIQFPFRFIAVGLVGCSFLQSYLTSKHKIFLLLPLILIFLSFKQWPAKYELYPVEYYSTNEATTNTHDEYLPIWTQGKTMLRADKKIEIISGEADTEIIKQKSNLLIMKVNSLEESKLKINTVFFPGWTAFLDNEQTKIFIDGNGLMIVEIPTGEHIVKLQFGETPLRLFSDIISLLTLLIILTYEIKKRFL